VFKAAAPTGADWSKATYVLPRNVAAIQVLADEFGRLRMGTILKLPEGAEVEDCGQGFDDRTRKICWQGGFYYIFTDDMELSNAARAS
jgi:hypothetical protein